MTVLLSQTIIAKGFEASTGRNKQEYRVKENDGENRIKNKADISLENTVEKDIQVFIEKNSTLLNHFKNRTLFLTGGTGFFGQWILEVLTQANSLLGLSLRVTLLTRSSQNFRLKSSRLALNPMVTLVDGDVRTFDLTPGQRFDFVIHAATDASAALNQQSPYKMIDTIVAGTQNILDLSLKTKAERVLFTSSGAVYGAQDTLIRNISEESRSAPDILNPKFAYAEGKRVAELLCSSYHQKHNMQISIARCFAFVGPYLPLDSHFAVGNFIGSVLKGEDIQILGDGTPHRSYLYALDLVEWLLAILIRGEAMRPYNVGAERSLSIEDTANLVANVARDLSELGISVRVPRVNIAKKPDPKKPTERYVPSTKRAQNELGLLQRISEEEAVKKTILWHLNAQH